MSGLDPFSLVQKIASDLSQEVIVFPTAFDTTIGLRKALNSEQTTANDIAAVVNRDPLLASKLVQAANSVALNPAGPKVTTIPAAVMRIGHEGVRLIALAVAMQQLRKSRQMVRYDALTAAIMAHSQQIGAISMVIARDCTTLCKDSAFFAGLVHDIGAFYLIYRIADQEDLEINDDELGEMLRDWHGSIGHAVLSALGMPEEILDAVADHDEPRPITAVRSLRDLIYCAHAIEPRLSCFQPLRFWRRESVETVEIGACEALVAVAESHIPEIEAIVALF